MPDFEERFLAPRLYNRFVLFMVLLVIGLRIWGDCDRPFYDHLPPDIAPLYRRLPSDDFRFVFNFPVSMLSTFLAPPPTQRPPMSTTGFVFRECLSIFLELFLTLAFWLGMPRLIKREPFSCFAKVPLRAALPLFFTLWSIYFSYVGTLQAQKVVARMDDPGFQVAHDMFAGFLLNAPAWFASNSIYMLYSYGNFSDELFPWHVEDFNHYEFSLHRIGHGPWEYFAVVIVMWFLIGFGLDRLKKCMNSGELDRPGKLGLIIWSLLGLYGVWLFHEATITFYLGKYDLWFAMGVMLWSAVTTCVSFYFLARNLRSGWGLIVSIVCTGFGFGALLLATLFSAAPRFIQPHVAGFIRWDFFYPYDKWRTLSIAAWGLALFLEGCYFLWHWKDRPTTPP